jgi:hypothetical protein
VLRRANTIQHSCSSTTSSSSSSQMDSAASYQLRLQYSPSDDSDTSNYEPYADGDIIHL